MHFWLQNKNRLEQVTKANKVVKEWIAEGEEEVKGQMGDAAEDAADQAQAKFNPSHMTREILNIIVKVI